MVAVYLFNHEYSEIVKSDNLKARWPQKVVNFSLFILSQKNRHECQLTKTKTKRCHHHHNGTGGTRLHFHGDDASAASMFIMKFFSHITANNLQEVMERQEKEML